jgi:putative membrane protein
MYFYLKALHIIFVVTWFAGLFYMPRLFIYNTEAGEMATEESTILRKQFSVMMRRLWYGITWPSAIITLIMGLSVLFEPSYKWYTMLFNEGGRWLLVKLVFVIFLYLYHFSLHRIFQQEIRGVFKYTSQQLRVWNEVASIFLVVIVLLATVKESMSFVWGLIGLILFIFLLLSAIRIYKIRRDKKARGQTR